MNPISTVFERMFCGQRSQASAAVSDVELGKPLPGSDSAEASRRRYIYSCYFEVILLVLHTENRNSCKLWRNTRSVGYDYLDPCSFLYVQGERCSCT